MITVLEAIKLSTEYLEKKQVESPRTNAEILLADILHCKRLDLYLSFDKPLSENELNLYRESIKQRAMRIPLQYILGYVEFFGLKINVNQNVLIPRPETELLVEKIINDFKSIKNLRILDIGSGSGNISLSLAKNLENSFVTGIDISDKAIEVAIDNAIKNSVANVEFKLLDIMTEEIFNQGKFDLIVSNPPYVSKNDYQTLEPELKVHEPRVALTDNADGLTFYNRIITIAKNILKQQGYLYFEIGKDQHEIIYGLMNQQKFNNIKIQKDYSGIERMIYGQYL
ncbi:MAG TPA: peptide chain release factor N(5)-glutamine methyltransferase [Ignavibacteriaceae bacterium]|nr:peptide chain release factor N(5)-glutamine methyltransferase [Ignavibacteriaceae bacterium]